MVVEIFYFFLVFPPLPQVGFTILSYLFLNTQTTVVFNHFVEPTKMCTLEQTRFPFRSYIAIFPKSFHWQSFPTGIYSFLWILLALPRTDSASPPSPCLLSWLGTLLYSFNLHTSLLQNQLPRKRTIPFLCRFCRVLFCRSDRFVEANLRDCYV